MHFHSEKKKYTKKLISNKQVRKYVQRKMQNKKTTQLLVAATNLFRKIEVESIERKLWRAQVLKNWQDFKDNLLQVQE